MIKSQQEVQQMFLKYSLRGGQSVLIFLFSYLVTHLYSTHFPFLFAGPISLFSDRFLIL